jgi:hypothetical protein
MHGFAFWLFHHPNRSFHDLKVHFVQSHDNVYIRVIKGIIIVLGQIGKNFLFSTKRVGSEVHSV